MNKKLSLYKILFLKSPSAFSLSNSLSLSLLLHFSLHSIRTLEKNYKHTHMCVSMRVIIVDKVSIFPSLFLSVPLTDVSKVISCYITFNASSLYHWQIVYFTVYGLAMYPVMLMSIYQIKDIKIHDLSFLFTFTFFFILDPTFSPVETENYYLWKTAEIFCVV